MTGSTNYPQWGLSWAYDRYGNRLNQTLTPGSGYQGAVQVTASSNRINCIGGSGQSCTGGVIPTYDANGNMTYDGTNTLVYDAENHAISATNQSSAGTYTYDGNGLRVKKVSGGTTTVTIFSGSMNITEYLNGAVPSSPTNEYSYSGGQFVAAIQSGATHYFHEDHLSVRFRTDTTGAVTDQRGTYPFGGQWYSTGGNSPLMFTSYYRDFESGNDYAQARYYASRLARFLSLDPLSGSTSDPQSLDRYTYVENNPISLIDPAGAMECETSDDNDCSRGGGGGWFGDLNMFDFGISGSINSTPCLAACGAADRYGVVNCLSFEPLPRKDKYASQGKLFFFRPVHIASPGERISPLASETASPRNLSQHRRAEARDRARSDCQKSVANRVARYVQISPKYHG